MALSLCRATSCVWEHKPLKEILIDIIKDLKFETAEDSLLSGGYARHVFSVQSSRQGVLCCDGRRDPTFLFSPQCLVGDQTTLSKSQIGS